MSTLGFQLRSRLITAVLVLLIMLLSRTLFGHTNLLQMGSSEGETRGGGQNFVDPSNATVLFDNMDTMGYWGTHTGTYWIQDLARTISGDRVLWLGSPISGNGELCTVYHVPMLSYGGTELQVVSGFRYSLKTYQASLDSTAPDTRDDTAPGLESNYRLGSRSSGGEHMSLTMLSQPFGEIDNWNSDASQTMAALELEASDDAAADHLNPHFSAPAGTPAAVRHGFLLDKMLTTLAPVPEPSSLLLAAVPLVLMAARRRRSAATL